MATFVQVDKQYVDKAVDTAQVTRDWAKLLVPTDAEYEFTGGGPYGIAAVYTIYFPFTDAGESATSGGAVTAGTDVAVSHSITLTERNSKKLTVKNLETLTATTPRLLQVVKNLTKNWITELNTKVKTFAMSTIPDSGNYTHEVNNSGSGGTQDVWTAGYVYLGNDVSASAASLAAVVAGDVLTPAIFRKMISTLRARKQAPAKLPIGDNEFMTVYVAAIQRDQIDYLKSHADFKANVNAPISDQAWTAMQVLYGNQSFLYEGALIIPVDDATKASVVGVSNADTAHYAVFMGADFIGYPQIDPTEIQVSDPNVERMNLFGESEIRLGADPTDAPLYKTKVAAWLALYGMGIVNPLAGIKLVLHSDAS